MSAPKATLDFTHQGRVARLTLAAPKANIVDTAMMDALGGAFRRVAGRPGVKVIVVGAEGPHFSFGASIEEHLPDKIGPTLVKLRELLLQVLDAQVPTIASVRGQCLGGGLELVLACDLLLAEETASLGCPEIKLGVFPPAAAAMLPILIGAGPASRLVLTGASISGTDGKRLGLVDRTAPADGLEGELSRWLEEDFLPLSATALHFATLASRRALRHAVEHDLPALERLYLDGLMATPDPVEGIRAFMERRKPQWQDDRERTAPGAAAQASAGNAQA
jgi:cyclohexa-1,5-dienecarbonyl-CoA hydratase